LGGRVALAAVGGEQAAGDGGAVGAGVGQGDQGGDRPRLEGGVVVHQQHVAAVVGPPALVAGHREAGVDLVGDQRDGGVALGHHGGAAVPGGVVDHHHAA